MNWTNRITHSFAVVLIMVTFIGCATTQDISLTNRKITDNFQQLESQDKAIRELKQRDSNLTEELQEGKKRLAEVSAQLQPLHEKLFTLQSNLEDYRQLTERSIKDTTRETEGIKMRLDRLEELSKRLADELTIVKEAQKKSLASLHPAGKAWEDLDEEAFYTLGYQTFQKGTFDTAREIFNAFLDKFPKGGYSDNATFWIGECYYQTNQYDRAVLEYEKVKQNYPSGDKVPSALFKQALCFRKLNKPQEAKIILKQLVEQYPQSEQSDLAKKELESLQ